MLIFCFHPDQNNNYYYFTYVLVKSNQNQNFPIVYSTSLGIAPFIRGQEVQEIRGRIDLFSIVLRELFLVKREKRG